MRKVREVAKVIVIVSSFLVVGLNAASLCALYALPRLAATLETKYSPSYSHKAFKKTRKGMQQEDVLELLGEPLHRRKLWEAGTWIQLLNHDGLHAVNGGECDAFFYSAPGRSGNYHQRVVVFDEQKKVVKVLAGMWYD